MTMAQWIVLAVVGVPAMTWTVALLQVWRTVRTLDVLARVEAGPREWPSLTTLVPARNEAGCIEQSLLSVASQDYPALEVVAVDDRSTDQTGQIIDRLAEEHPSIVPVHVETLPDGWLGKLNALHHGLQQASGDWLLFADADTHYAEGALKRAVAYAVDHDLDLLTVYPHLTSRAFFADTVFAAAPVLAHVTMPFWAVRDPDHSAFAGMGAFILIRRSLWEMSEGLEWLRLEVADDMGLGLVVQRTGGKLDIINGRDQVFIQFYGSLREMVRRMQKNWWGIVARYSMLRATSLSLLLCWLVLSPLVALWPDTPFWMAGIAAWGALAFTGASVLFNRWVARPLLPTLFPQVGLLLCAFQLIRATWIGLRTGGIEWRGVHYSSHDLRRYQRVKV